MEEEDETDDEEIIPVFKTNDAIIKQTCDIDIDQILLSKRFSRNELVLRFLSFVCLSLMFGLFLLQLDILWRSRESLVMELSLEDLRRFYYPDFYDDAHNEDMWCWDPDTMLLTVNTTFFVH